MPLLLKALSRKRVFSQLPSPYHIASGTTAAPPLRQTGMNVFAGKPSDVITASEKGSNCTSISPFRVDIAIENPYHFRGEVIASDVPLYPLKETTPALLQYLTIDGAQIILPRSEAVDWSLLLNLVDLIIDQHRSGKTFDIEIRELPQDPVKLIKLHIILELFGLHYQAHNLLEHLWFIFETHTLALADAFWVWGVLGPHKYIKWAPQSAEVYLQMMAWNILKADAEGRLHSELRTFFLEEEGHPYHLTCLLKQHFSKYGLGHGRQPVLESTSRKRKDTATEYTEEVGSHCNTPTPLSVSEDGPIFPARWLFPPKCKDPRKPVDIEALFPDEKWDSRKWNRRWDSKEKDVKNMAAERDGLVSLGQSQAFPKNVGKPPVYVDFGYVGWCDEKVESRKR